MPKEEEEEEDTVSKSLFLCVKIMPHSLSSTDITWRGLKYQVKSSVKYSYSEL